MHPLSQDARFAEARLLAIGNPDERDSIGRLAERSLHRTVKYYIEPDKAYHEIKHGGFVCDIKRGDRITEVQTRAFSKLRPKLDGFLADCQVRIIYPLHRNKLIRFINAESGEMTSPRRSPKHQRVYDAAYELYNIREYLKNPRLAVTLMFFESEEYKIRGVKRKIGRHYRKTERVECIPIRLLDEIEISAVEDLLVFLPEGLPQQFSAPDINRAIGGGFKHGYSIARLLEAVGLIEARREGRRVIYSLKR